MSTSQSNWSGWFQLLSLFLFSFYYVTISVTSRFFWKFCTVIPQLWSLVPFFGRHFVPAFESGRLEQLSTFLAYWYWYQNSVTFRPAAATIWLSHLARQKSTDDVMCHGWTSAWTYQDYFKQVHICLNSNFEFSGRWRINKKVWKNRSSPLSHSDVSMRKHKMKRTWLMNNFFARAVFSTHRGHAGSVNMCILTWITGLGSSTAALHPRDLSPRAQLDLLIHLRLRNKKNLRTSCKNTVPEQST